MSGHELKGKTSPIRIINDLIMELSYMRSKIKYSHEKLLAGIEVIDFLMTLPDMPLDEIEESKWGISPLDIKKDVIKNEIITASIKDKLLDARKTIKNSIEKSIRIENQEIEEIQKLLLDISLPMSRAQVSILRNNKFTPIRL